MLHPLQFFRRGNFAYMQQARMYATRAALAQPPPVALIRFTCHPALRGRVEPEISRMLETLWKKKCRKIYPLAIHTPSLPVLLSRFEMMTEAQREKCFTVFESDSVFESEGKSACIFLFLPLLFVSAFIRFV